MTFRPLSARSLRSTATIIAAATAIAPATAQELSLNYERLSSIEEPVAMAVGNVTLLLNGVIDLPVTVGGDDPDADEAGLIGNVEVTALAQLPNRWRVELGYFGQRATDAGLVPGSDDRTTDHGALAVGGAWGTVLAGHVSGLVREQTRRHRGAGNAVLAFDDVRGGLGEESAGYVGRFGPWVFSTVVDTDGHIDLGAMFQRPLGNRDWRVTARLTDGVLHAPGSAHPFPARAGSLVGEMIFGSSSFDVGLGHERLAADGISIERPHVAAGAQTKIGVITLSIEGRYASTDDAEEKSAALGLQYDMARGLSLNAGINFANGHHAHDGVGFVETDETEAVLSTRYSF